MRNGEQRILHPKIIDFFINIFFVCLVLEILGNLLLYTPNFHLPLGLKEPFIQWGREVFLGILLLRSSGIFFLFLSLIALFIKKKVLVTFYSLGVVLGFLNWGMMLFFTSWSSMYGVRGLLIIGISMVFKFLYVYFFVYLRKKGGLS